jgi:hypothetical protein
VIQIAALPVSPVQWRDAVRIVRGRYPLIDLFEDLADPADWPLLIAAERKTNPRLMESLGRLDLVPPLRRVAGPGASYLMTPFTHVSPDRPSRFSDGTYGVLYAGNRFEVALFETIHHHSRFMERTNQPAGWTSRFRELLMDMAAPLHDLRGNTACSAALDPDDYAAGQELGAKLRAANSDGVVYPSVRCANGECVGLFYPDGAAHPRQGRHLDYHWDGARIDLYRDVEAGNVYRIIRAGQPTPRKRP